MLQISQGCALLFVLNCFGVVDVVAEKVLGAVPQSKFSLVWLSLGYLVSLSITLAILDNCYDKTGDKLAVGFPIQHYRQHRQNHE